MGGQGGQRAFFGGGMQQQNVAVEVAAIKKGDLQVSKKIIGTVVPLSQTDVFPKSAEVLAGLYVGKGDYVEKGQVLATLDSSEYKQNLSLEQASVENTKKQYQNALLSKDQAENEFKKAKQSVDKQVGEEDLDIKNLRLQWESAKKDLERQEALFEKKAITLSEVEQARLKEEQAKIAYEKALDENEDTYTQANIKLQQAELSVEQAKLSVQQAEIKLEQIKNEMVIYAPISGEIQAINYKMGEEVSTQNPLLTIINTSSLSIETEVTTEYKNLLHEGEEVQIKAAANDKEVKGVVTYIAPGLNERGLYDVEMKLADSKTITSGENVQIVFSDTLVSDQLLVPTASILQKGDQNYVFIAKDGKALKKDIEIINMQTDWTAVEGDINEGDQLVIKGHKLLSDGMNVLLPGEELPVQGAGAGQLNGNMRQNAEGILKNRGNSIPAGQGESNPARGGQQ